jgi:hypothetical protein
MGVKPVNGEEVAYLKRIRTRMHKSADPGIIAILSLFQDWEVHKRSGILQMKQNNFKPENSFSRVKNIPGSTIFIFFKQCTENFLSQKPMNRKCFASKKSFLPNKKMRTTGSYESVGELLLETMSLKCYFG